MSKIPKPVTEQILDWFEHNPGAKMRSGPLAKALKADATRTADALGRLVSNGQLDRVLVTVPANERGRAAAEQWEYWLPIGGKVVAPPPPYTPPKSYRREATQPTAPAAVATERSDEKIPDFATMARQLEQQLFDASHKIAALEQAAKLDKELIKELHAGHDKLVSAADEIKVDMAQKLADSEARVAELEAALAKTNSQPVATLEAIEPAGYVVATPNKPLRRSKLEKNALQLAMSAARTNGFAEVFAIYPAGKAVRGAEWKPRSWPSR